jgi:hypothetical protein
MALPFPVLILVGGIVVEIVMPLCLRRSTRLGLSTWATLLRWIWRPWMVWAVFNLYFRSVDHFNNPLTFPFFANPWWKGESFFETAYRLIHMKQVWIWSGVVWNLIAVHVLLLRWVMRRPTWSGTSAGRVLLMVYPLAVATHLAMAVLPKGYVDPLEGRSSLIAPWFESSSTMVYAAKGVVNSRDYISHFQERLGKLRSSIHAVSHPPLASLSLYWIGRPLGAHGDVYRDRLKYCAALTLFAGLNVLMFYLLGRALSGSVKVGLICALVWPSLPFSQAYSVYAQDSLYAVFFNLALLLIWWVGVAEGRRVWVSACALGSVLFCLALLNYSVCIVVAILGVFLLVMAWRERRSVRDLAWRGGLPLVVAGGVLLWFEHHYHFDYWQCYCVSREYVGRFYGYKSAEQWMLALVGGQMDLALMTGSVMTCAFIVAVRTAYRDGLAWSAPHRLALVTLFVYFIPILIGPNALKMEVSRCWMWVMSVPVVVGVMFMERQSDSRRLLSAAMVSGYGVYWGMRLFLCFR